MIGEPFLPHTGAACRKPLAMRSRIGSRRAVIPTIVFILLSSQAMAQTAEDPVVSACKSTGLLALKERSPEISDLVIDLESVAISKADTKVEDVPIKTVVLGEAYIARKEKTGRPDRFVCLLGDKGKVLLTFFTAQ
jgi:hypothetical protein